MSPSTLEPDTQRPARPALQVAIVTDEKALTNLEAEWRQLAASCSTATVFQTWEWNAAWWRHYGRRTGRRLHILTWRDEDGRLVGLAPLMVSFWYATPLRRLSFVGTGASDYLDLLAAPGWEEDIAAGLYGALSAWRGWQIADLQQLRHGGLLRQHPPTPETGLSHLDAPGEACPYLELPGDWDSLTANLGKKTRSNIAYHDRALRKVFVVESAAVADPDELNDEMTRLFDLHQRRWNQRWLPGVFGGKGVQRFHRDAAQALLESGMLRLFCLRLDGQTQASLLCYAFGDRLCYYQGGFEPTLAKWSLGTVLTAHALRTAVGEGRAVFDFLRGDEPYKAKWTHTAHSNARRLITRRGRTGCGPLARTVQRWEERIERRAKAWGAFAEIMLTQVGERRWRPLAISVRDAHKPRSH